MHEPSDGTRQQTTTTADQQSSVVVTPIHTAVRGRVRYRINTLYRNRDVKLQLEQHLPKTVGIQSVRASELTGTVLILYTTEDIPDNLTRVLQAFSRVSDASLNAAQSQNPTVIQQNSATKTAKVASISEHRRARAIELATNRTNDANAKTTETWAWHCISAERVLTAMDSSELYGLSAKEIKRRLRKYGRNQLPSAAKRSSMAIFVEQFMTLPVGLLTGSAVVSILTGGLLDAAVIMGVVGINAAIGFFTERHAEDTINALSKITPRHTRVLRQGHIEEILHRDVVVGDILLLTPGDFIAADARLLKDNRLTLDESALTGESMPVSKTTEFIAKPDTPLADRRNMVYMGTMVTGGNALAVVVATGRQTQLGQIQSMVGETQAPETPMQRQLDQMGFQLGILSGAICAGVFGVGLLRGLGWLQMLKGSISLAVAAVPEGLPTVATTTLALGIRDMRNKRVAIRHLDAVETLGAVQVLCLDKTGTLTINRMTVVAIYVAQKRLVVANKQFYADGQKIDGLSHDELLHLLQIVTLCSESDLNGKADEQTVTGTPTENALIEAALAAGVDVHAVRSNFPRRHIRHRAEDRPFMSTIHGTPEGQKLLAMKGSPAEVLAHCTTVLQDGELVPLDDDLRDALRQENTRMAGDALRVLGVAYTVVDGRDKIDPDRLIWLGLVGMTDPLRPGMTELMQVFHSAGIHTVMITGDQSATAYAVGKQLRLSGDQPLQLLDSAKLDKLDPELLKGLIPKVHVFARVSPAHKLEIVQAIQRAGNVVAMTGDGINDGPALKAADIGVAMGGADSDVARSVADVVLEDDNLQTMSVAVQQGRATYNDIRKALHYLLATNLSEIEIMLMSISLGLGQPLNPMQLLWINLISDIFPALALSMEPAEPDLMDRPPRESKEHIIRRQDLRKMARESAVITTGSLASYLYALNRYGRGPQANTLAFHSLTLAQLVHAISCRSDTHSIFSKGKLPRNPYLNWAIGGSLAVQLLAMLVPGVRGLLGITRMGGLDTLVAVAGAIGPMLINEASKHISKNGMPRRLPSSTAGLDNPEETTTIEETPT